MTNRSDLHVDTTPARRNSFVRRQSWVHDGYAHIDVLISVDGRTGADESRAIEEAVEAVNGVRWAAYNGALKRVVVSYDGGRPTLADVTRAVARTERELGGPHPFEGIPDLDPSLADRAALGADLLGLGAGLIGRVLRVPRLPAELAAAPAAFEVLPLLGNGLRAALGRVRADLGLSLASSAIGAVSQMNFTSLADAVLRVGRLSEASAYRDAWARRAKDLHSDAETSRAATLPDEPRPSPLADGPIERYAQRISTVTLLAAAGLLVLPGGRRRAAQALVVGSPRAAGLGREAYASRLGQTLARRGVMVRDRSALRRLDRIRTVVVDAPILFTGRIMITEVIPASGSAEEARHQSARLLDAVVVSRGRPALPITRDGWSLAVPSRPAASVPGVSARRGGDNGSASGEVVALTRNGVLAAYVRIEAELDPHCASLMSAARKVGRVLIAGAGPDLAKRARADGTTAGGSRLADSVRALQRNGSGVALLAASNDVALAAADCGVGILTATDRRPPWGGHLMAGPGLETAWLVLESASLASRVSGRSARLALLGSVAGAFMGVVDRGPQPGRNAIGASGAAGLANVISGLWSARELGRLPVPVPEALVPWHALSTSEVMRLLDTSPDGLSEDQARQRRTAPDRSRDNGEPGLLTASVAELNTPLTAPLAASAGISAATGSTVDAVLVLGVLLANALLSAGQNVRAARAMRRLLTAGSLQARLGRRGESRMAPAEDVVPGDVVFLEPGDAVPADCRLIATSHLEVDESTLTGESVPVLKDVAPTPAVAIADRTSMVYAGTSIAAGSATAVVVATGRATEAGRSASMVAGDAPSGGVEARLRAMASASIPVSAAAAAALLVSGAARGRLAESVSSSVALAVAAIPEGLPFVATAAELSASRRLARHNILIRNRRALEALGRVDVICFDKTAPDRGRIRVRAVSNGRTHRFIEAAGPVQRRILAAALRASPIPNGDEILPHPTDRAVVSGAEQAGIGVRDGAAGWRLVREFPFEPARGFHAVLGNSSSGQMISVKGSPEVVLPRCVTWSRSGRARSLTDADRREIDAEVDRLAQQGLRVLAVAERTASSLGHLDDERVARLELRGLLGLADTTRPSAAEAVSRLRRAGVTVVMLTGDHPSTAEAIGAELDLLDGGTVVTGPDLDEADDLTVDALVAKASVFARVTPAHKVAVVRSLRRAGRVVAVTGDGSNDAPAIRLADVGIALGDQGTAAARQAADMIVVDGRIETIADGVIEGRAMWAAVRDAVALLLGGNLGEILFAAGSSAFSARPPLNARQILFVNLMTDLLPAMTVASRTPRGVTPQSLAREGPESSLGTALTHDIARRAITTSLATTGGWLTARFTGTAGRASSVAMASLVASQLAQTVTASRGDPAVLASVGLSMAALIGTVQTPGVSHFFGSRPLGPVGWTTVLAAAVAAGLIGAIPSERLPGLTQAVERLLTAGTRLSARAAGKSGPQAQ